MPSPPRNRKGCLDFNAMIPETGENERGMVNINVTGNQVGLRPRDMLGRQQWGWGEDLNGDRFKPFGPMYADGGEEGGEGGLFGAMPVSPKRTKKR